VLLTKSHIVAPGLSYLAEVDSTNLELSRQNSAKSLPDRTVLAAGLQNAGKGRLGRSWVSEPETSLSVSILLRPKSQDIASWATLVAAASVRHAIEHLTGVQAKVKWPNDVLVGDNKISGILAQLQTDGSVVLGIGINLKAQAAAPDTATSLAALGFDVTFDELLAAFLTAFFSRWELFEVYLKIAIEKTRNELVEHSATLGEQVRAILPGGEEVVGLASDIDLQGHLVIATPQPRVLAAADVWHLRK
jgi:BirA family biotin operon repressor/biotin-[acetyl-CoA-carboxylase] ligase